MKLSPFSKQRQRLCCFGGRGLAGMVENYRVIIDSDKYFLPFSLTANKLKVLFQRLEFFFGVSK